MQTAHSNPEILDEELLTTRQVLDLIKVDKSTVYRMAEQGRIPAIKVGRQWRFPAEQLRSWLATNGTSTAALPPPARQADDSIPVLPLTDLLRVFADLLGVMMVITDMDGVPITPVVNPCGLFEVFGDDPAVVERCIRGWTGSDGSDLRTDFMTTSLGFECIHGYLRVGDRLTGMVLAGGIAPREWPPTPAEIEAGAAAVGLDPEIIAAHIEEVYHLNRFRRQEVKSALPRIAGALSNVISDRTQPDDSRRPEMSVAVDSDTRRTK